MGELYGGMVDWEGKIAVINKLGAFFLSPPRNSAHAQELKDLGGCSLGVSILIPPGLLYDKGVPFSVFLSECLGEQAGFSN